MRVLVLCVVSLLDVSSLRGEDEGASLGFIRISGDGEAFAVAETDAVFRPWGVNYDHDVEGRLIEDYWRDEWATVEEDFAEIKALGANVVRVHLQLGRFMASATEPDARNLARLADLLELAEKSGLYLDLTGLGCYHKADIPAWYDALDETERWQTQARFWTAIAGTCAASPAVFCYDLMNEPILPGEKGETDWLGGEFGGKYFVQRIALARKGRKPEEIAASWIDTMVGAIRKADPRHLVTVGVIPWAMVFPKAKPLFHDPETGKRLDFVSVHFYPETGKIDQALEALDAYKVGKPLVVEEFFPLRCTGDEMEDFIARAGPSVDGWVSFYWGRTAAEYAKAGDNLENALVGDWLRRFHRLAPAATGPE